MVEIAEAHVDGDHNCVLHYRMYLMLHFHHVYVHQSKWRCFAEKPPERN